MRLAFRRLLVFAVLVIGMISYGVSGLASHEFIGGLEFVNGTQPGAVGVFESDEWILSIDACKAMTVTLNTVGCRLVCSDLGVEIPTWWRVWDSSGNHDGKLDGAELVDSGWIAVSDFIIHWNNEIISIPSGWSGEIKFQLKMERNGLGDPAGSYSSVLDVTVSEAP
jgi:hypothetical protein